MNIKTVKLSKSVPGSKGATTTLRFREPRYDDYIANGDPDAFIQTAEGSMWRQLSHKVIDDYARLLLIDEDSNVLSLLELKDTMRVTEAILGFFREAAAPAPASAALPESSSSPSSGTPEPSAG